MNFCNQFFNLGKHIHEKIEKSIHESIFFSINFLSLKTNHFFFWSIINMWFHIIGNYTAKKIHHSKKIDCPKYHNRYQALFRHKSHMTAKLYLVYILSIQASWENWKKTPQTTWDTQKIFLSLQLHIQHLIRSSG